MQFPGTTFDSRVTWVLRAQNSALQDDKYVRSLLNPSRGFTARNHLQWPVV
jgi:hypothetical protein